MTKTFQSSQISLCANTNSIGRETVLGCQRSLRKKAEQQLINNQFSNASVTSGNDFQENIWDDRFHKSCFAERLKINLEETVKNMYAVMDERS